MDKDLLQFIQRKGKEHFGPSVGFQVILFGSRARKDHQERSDYDIAIRFGSSEPKNWSSFYVEVLEESPTLKKIDLVNLGKCPTDLRRSILKEGQIVYEHKI